MKSATRVLFSAWLSGLIGAQVQPIVISPLANGFNPDPDLKIKAKATIEQDRLTSQPGADTGWHTHPGAALVVVTRAP
jgi:hypothetical protein